MLQVNVTCCYELYINTEYSVAPIVHFSVPMLVSSVVVPIVERAYSFPYLGVTVMYSKSGELHKLSLSLTMYFHTSQIRFLPLLLTKCNYSKKIEAG
jgi:hypothetical protein